MFFAGWFTYAYVHQSSPSETLKESKDVITKPFEKYAIESLQKANVSVERFSLGEKLAEEKEYTSYLFSYTFNPEVTGTTKKKTTGQVNIPKGEGPFPLVILFRGYVDQKLYTTGTGTRPAASFFARNGFITIAPDFLGYGGSDLESSNTFETRLQTYVTASALLRSLTDPTFQTVTESKWDKKNVFIWAHSNGGQIALTALEITGVSYPTTLWAPASKPFPYVVLYYTDESDDGGKFIRKELAKFEELYDTDKYSYTNFIDLINAPIQLQQGTNDSAVPISWSNELAERLRSKEKEVNYFTYPGADHNLRPSWDTVIERDLDFFKKHLII